MAAAATPPAHRVFGCVGVVAPPAPKRQRRQRQQVRKRRSWSAPAGAVVDRRHRSRSGVHPCTHSLPRPPMAAAPTPPAHHVFGVRWGRRSGHARPYRRASVVAGAWPADEGKGGDTVALAPSGDTVASSEATPTTSPEDVVSWGQGASGTRMCHDPSPDRTSGRGMRPAPRARRPGPELALRSRVPPCRALRYRGSRAPTARLLALRPELPGFAIGVFCSNAGAPGPQPQGLLPCDWAPWPRPAFRGHGFCAGTPPWARDAAVRFEGGLQPMVWRFPPAAGAPARGLKDAVRVATAPRAGLTPTSVAPARRPGVPAAGG